MLADEITTLRARIAVLEVSIDKAENEAHDMGLADGRAAAIQEIDVATGGEGEYRFCTDLDPDRHTPDPDTMTARIVERFATLKASIADEREDAARALTPIRNRTTGLSETHNGENHDRY
jgi:hypothetical protein